MLDKKPWQTPGGVLLRKHTLTADEVRALQADRAARIAALERRWHNSGCTDTQALLGALVFYQPQLPSWLFGGLWKRLERQLPQEPPPYHKLRWLMVRQELEFDPSMTLPQAYKIASDKLAHMPAPPRGNPSAMEKSYQKIERELPPARRRRRQRRQVSSIR
jgi:hypothetical protein